MSGPGRGTPRTAHSIATASGSPMKIGIERRKRARLLQHEHRRARLQIDADRPERDLDHAPSLDPAPFAEHGEL